MSFPRYPKYKASGIEWLGEVPERWEVRRLKNLVEEPLKYGANESAELDDRTLPRFVRITDIDDDGGLRDETFKSLPTEVAEPYLLKEGDVLLARSGATVGKSFIYSREWGTACFAGYLIRARLRDSHCMPTWLYYYCQTDGYWGYVVGSQIQSTIQNVSAEKYANLYLPLPPRDEQAKIASFLDRETSKIDGLVGEQRRLIELLKEKRQAVISHAVTKGLNPHAPLKPSGIQWLGDVPEHWKVLPLHRVVQERRRITYGIVQPGEPDPSGRFMVRGQDYSNGWANPDGIFRVSDAVEVPYQRARLRSGDLVITIVGAGVGNIAVVPEWLDGANITQTTARIAVDPRKADSQFVAAVLQGPIGKRSVELYAKGAAQPGLNLEHVRIFPITVPPPDEQREIAKFIRSRTEGLDALTAEAERAIELLQERRTALISAAVTGQIDVRGLVETEAAS